MGVSYSCEKSLTPVELSRRALFKAFKTPSLRGRLVGPLKPAVQKEVSTRKQVTVWRARRHLPQRSVQRPWAWFFRFFRLRLRLNERVRSHCREVPEVPFFVSEALHYFSDLPPHVIPAKKVPHARCALQIHTRLTLPLVGEDQEGRVSRVALPVRLSGGRIRHEDREPGEGIPSGASEPGEPGEPGEE